MHAWPLIRMYCILLACTECRTLLVSSTTATPEDDRKELAPLCRPQMIRPSSWYCWTGSQTRSTIPCTGGQRRTRAKKNVGREECGWNEGVIHDWDSISRTHLETGSNRQESQWSGVYKQTRKAPLSHKSSDLYTHTMQSKTCFPLFLRDVLHLPASLGLAGSSDSRVTYPAVWRGTWAPPPSGFEEAGRSWCPQATPKPSAPKADPIRGCYKKACKVQYV